MRNDKGQFAEGCEGRKVGTPNKATTEIKEAFQMLLRRTTSKACRETFPV